MTLPASFAREGFVPLSSVSSGKYKRLLVGTDGWPDTGKTEFGFSAPGPIINIVLDRGIDGVVDNSTPPPTRSKDIAIMVVKVPLSQGAKNQAEYVEYWNEFYKVFKLALANPDARTVILDGDSDSWELQRLAEFGRIEQIPQLKYGPVKAARRAMIARAWDTGKIFIATNKLKKAGKEKDGKWQETGEEERQGFPDQDYLYHMQLRHYRNATTGEFGVRVMKCKKDTGLVGLELEGAQCNMQSLLEAVYPEINPTVWGYK